MRPQLEIFLKTGISVGGNFKFATIGKFWKILKKYVCDSVWTLLPVIQFWSVY